MTRRRRGGGSKGSTSKQESDKKQERGAKVNVRRKEVGDKQWFDAFLVVLALVIVLAAAISFLRSEKEDKNEATRVKELSLDEKALNDNVPKNGKSPKRTKSKSSERSEKHINQKQIFVGASYKVLEVIPHDKSAFTQGLTFFNGTLYEGTGLYGQSELRELSPVNGSVIRSRAMDPKHFGEGITHFRDKGGAERILQITWKERVAILYDAKNFEALKELTYDTLTSEGWGITYDEISNEFIVSDGSHWLFFWDVETLEEKRRVEVKLPSTDDHGVAQRYAVPHINELEFFNGHVLANVWYLNILIRIDPQSGDVTKVYDFTGLYKDRIESADCFNGIAVSDAEGQLFLTGKNWPHMYRILLLS